MMTVPLGCPTCEGQDAARPFPRTPTGLCSMASDVTSSQPWRARIPYVTVRPVWQCRMSHKHHRWSIERLGRAMGLLAIGHAEAKALVMKFVASSGYCLAVGAAPGRDAPPRVPVAGKMVSACSGRGTIMGPKSILWVTVSVVSGIWYAMDPAAHPIADPRVSSSHSTVGPAPWPLRP